MMKGEKGITLIALVITIIVMLILVVVTISFAMNGDLFGKAKTSTIEYRTAQINEAIALTKADLYTAYYAQGTNSTGGDRVTVYSASDVEDMINAYLAGSNLAVTVTGGTPAATGTTYNISSSSDNIEAGNVTSTIVCDFWKN